MAQPNPTIALHAATPQLQVMGHNAPSVIAMRVGGMAGLWPVHAHDAIRMTLETLTDLNSGKGPAQQDIRGAVS